MKIVFICGSLEPGRDGVGDYTRRLAAELLAMGHQTAIVAINDKYLGEVLKAELPALQSAPLMLRLSANWENKPKYQYAKEWLQLFNPDWISMQFVIYAYHPKGLPFGLPNLLAGVGGKAKWHIMFHEIWIGFTKISPFKHKVTGYFQRRIVLSLVKALKPEAITTSNFLYQLVLKSVGVKAAILPLFSNIPVYPKGQPITKVILDQLGIADETGLKEWRLAGIFGNLYPEANLLQALDGQLALAQNRDLKLAFISFGRISGNATDEIKRLELIFKDRIKFICLGEQSPENVSGLLQLLNVGISCTPLQHLGKSGVFAAMKLHALEVVVAAEEIIPEYHAAINNYHGELVKRAPDEWSVSNIAADFMNLLN